MVNENRGYSPSRKTGKDRLLTTGIMETKSKEKTVKNQKKEETV